MKPEMKGKATFGVWGLIIGAIVVVTVGFAWGGWVTQNTAQKMSDEAVLANQAAICVAQFVKQPNHQERLKELGKIDSWKRSEFVEKGAGTKCPARKRPPLKYPKPAPKGLRF
jgi:hypothetical protein